MNTLAHLGAFVAVLWLSLEALTGELIPSFDNVRPLGFALLAFAMVWLVLLIVAVLDDSKNILGRGGNDDDS